MGEIKQANFRLDEDKANEFREFCEQQGFNHAQGFDYIMGVLALEQAKGIVSNREMEISDFEMHAKALVEAYIRSLEICNTTEVRVREDFQSQLISKDKQIIDYQAKIDNLKKDIETSKSAVKESSKEIQERYIEISELNKQIGIISKQVDTFKASNEALTSALTLSEEKSKANEVAARNYANAVKELDALKLELEKSRNILAQTEEKHKTTLDHLESVHASELKQMEIQNQLNIKSAVELIKSDYEAKIDKINIEYTKRADAYQDKLEKATEKTDHLREQMQAEIDKYKQAYNKVAAELKEIQQSK